MLLLLGLLLKTTTGEPRQDRSCVQGLGTPGCGYYRKCCPREGEKMVCARHRGQFRCYTEKYILSLNSDAGEEPIYHKQHEGNTENFGDMLDRIVEEW